MVEINEKSPPDLFNAKLKFFLADEDVTITLDKPMTRERVRDEAVSLLREGFTIYGKDKLTEVRYPAHAILKMGIMLTPVKVGNET